MVACTTRLLIVKIFAMLVAAIHCNSIKATFRMRMQSVSDHRSVRLMSTVPTTPTSTDITVNPYLVDKSEFQNKLKGQLILAPLTRGGNLPYRRLCADYGADFTMSEMAYARFLFRGRSNSLIRKERALMKKAANEKYFGFQIATNSADEILKALELCYDTNNVTFIDLNCGCPIYEASRRGLGAIMLKHPKKIHKLLNMVMPNVKIPLTVKIRLGVEESKINAMEMVDMLYSNGVAAVTIHGRTMEQRYTKPADWEIIHEISSRYPDLPIIGNGDILAWYEATDRLGGYSGSTSSMSGMVGSSVSTSSTNNINSGSGSTTTSSAMTAAAVMTGRGALIKPWIFQEFKHQTEYEPTAEERIHIYYKLGSYFKEHFGIDERGKQSAFYFFPWHFNFLCRYRPLPKAVFYETSKIIPLIQNSRMIDEMLIKEGYMSDLRITPVQDRNKPLDSLLDQLLRCTSADAHLAIAEALWLSETREEAVNKLQQLAEEKLVLYQTEQAAGSSRNNSSGDNSDDDEREGGTDSTSKNSGQNRNNNREDSDKAESMWSA